jgi:phospholipid N-methyltransferase
MSQTALALDLRFLGFWLSRPLQIGAVAPSGRSLSLAMVRAARAQPGQTVVELGAGTGSFTHALLTAGVRPEQLVAVEQHPDLCRILRGRFPGLRVLCGDAARLDRLLKAEGLWRPGEVSAVVSGVPMLTIPKATQISILRHSFSQLAAAGSFVQFTYGLGCPVAARLLRALGLRAGRIGHVWRNLPPAAIWRIERCPAR